MKENSSFYISKQNKRGVFIILCISITIVFTPRFIQSFREKKKYQLTSEDLSELNEKTPNSFHNSIKNRKKSYTKKRYQLPPKKFDPNSYTKENWMYLGLSEKQAQVVLNFARRGLYSNEQLQKIFVISDGLFELIKDSTFYPERDIAKKNFVFSENQSPNPKKSIIQIELNEATQADLESIRGIGSFFAKNIIRYRERLGGFVRKEQLLEVWKFDTAKYNEIEPFITINDQLIKKINLNTASAEELKSFPYFNWNIANSIVKMRNRLERYHDIEQIKESELIDEELFDKIKPYLSL